MQVALLALVDFLSIFPYCSFKILVALLVIVKRIVPPFTHVPCQIQADPLALVRYRSPPFPYQIYVVPPPTNSCLGQVVPCPSQVGNGRPLVWGKSPLALVRLPLVLI